MDVSDEGSNAGQVVGIEGGGGCGLLGGNGWIVFWVEREATKSGSAFSTSAVEEDGVVFGEDGDAVFFEEHFAAIVAELAHSNKVVFEGGHNLGIVDR